MLRQAFLTAILATALGGGPPALAAPALDPALLAGMEARPIGPAAMSGRVASIDVVESDTDILYVGAATGGVWKSVSAGLTWEPIFDDQPVAAIGAVSVYQPQPDIVWVGTGEGNPRNSASVGNGVYRSIDGGRTWEHAGLEGSERIHRIVLVPGDPDAAFVAALGPTWGESETRGVFKTVDGGKSWSKVLYVNETTGAADLVIDPANPRKLLAAMWDHRRWPWFFRSGGQGSGLYLTYDGGDSWKRLTPEDGLPEGDLGRIGLAIAPSDPRIVYALVETEAENVLLRSDDGGHRWERRSDSSQLALGNRPFYFADLRVDPQNADRVYSLWSLVSVSNDGGKTFEVLVPFEQAHPDHHAMWINPSDPSHLVEGNDGGVYISRDRGESWRFVGNLPLAQFYHLRVDQEHPYHVYGGLQDNGSWKGPSAVWENGGIRSHHWQELFFGDGFDVVPDPLDPMQGYAMSQEGYLARWDLRTGERKMIRPVPPEGEELRFNWNAGIALDPFDPDTVYFGSQYVHRSADRGESWQIISPDLTTDNPQWQRQAESGGLTPDVTGAENYTTLLSIAPSPVERGVIWVGTDDGRIHVTRDGGASWTSVENNVPGVPANTWVPHLEPSRFDGARAFAVFDDHRRSNWTPYLFETADYGRTWRGLATDEIRGYALALAEDPVDPDLLFLGTEFGLYVSFDHGGSWLRWTHGVPTVSVMDLVVHPRDHDLVLGTHGRGVFILDDVGPLRALSDEIAAAPLHLFEIPAAQQYRVAQTGSSRFPGDGEFRGDNRPYGALITYSLNLPGLPHPDDETERARREEERTRRRAGERFGEEEGPIPAIGPQARAKGDDEEEEEEEPEVEIRVADAEGEVLRTFEAPARLGINRSSWDLRRDAFEEPEKEKVWEREVQGPEVPPGRYTITVSYGEHQASQTVEVVADPRFDISDDDRRARWAAQLRAGSLQERVTEAVERIRQAREDVRTILARGDEGGEEEAGASPEDDGAGTELAQAAHALERGLDALERRLWIPPESKGIIAETDIQSWLERARWFLDSAWDAPSAAQLGYLERTEALAREAFDELNAFFADEVADFREQARAAGIDLLPEQEPIEISDGT